MTSPNYDKAVDCLSNWHARAAATALGWITEVFRFYAIPPQEQVLISQMFGYIPSVSYIEPPIPKFKIGDVVFVDRFAPHCQEQFTTIAGVIHLPDSVEYTLETLDKKVPIEYRTFHGVPETYLTLKQWR